MEQKYPHKWCKFSFFCWHKKSTHFPFSVFWLHSHSCIHSIHFCFEKNNSSFVLFFVLVVPNKKTKEKRTQKRGWNCCSFKSFFFNKGTNKIWQKKQSLVSPEAQAWVKTPHLLGVKWVYSHKAATWAASFSAWVCQKWSSKTNKQQKMFAKLLRFRKKNKMSEETNPLSGNLDLQGMLITQSLDFDSTWITIRNGVILESLTSYHDTCGWLWVCHNIVKVREKKISWLSNSFWLGLNQNEDEHWHSPKACCWNGQRHQAYHIEQGHQLALG